MIRLLTLWLQAWRRHLRTRRVRRTTARLKAYRRAQEGR